MALIDKLKDSNPSMIGGDSDRDKETVARAISDCIEEDGAITSGEVYDTLFKVLNLEKTFYNHERVFGKYVNINSGNPHLKKFDVQNIRISKAILRLIAEKSNERTQIKIISPDLNKEKSLFYKTEEGLKTYLSRRVKELKPVLVLNYEFSREPYKGGKSSDK